MSNKQPGDEQIERILWEAEDGLQAPGEQDRQAVPGDGNADRDSGVRGPTRPLRPRQDPVSRWLLPAATVVLVVLVVGALMLLSQGDRVARLEREVAALRGNGAGQETLDGLRSDLRDLDARVADLSNRIDVNGNEARREIAQQLESQRGEIEALSGRMAALEKSAGAPANKGSEKASSSSAAPAADSTSSGRWVVNLVAVADAASAEQVRERLRDMGVKSRIESIKAGDTSLRRVTATGFGSYEQARDFASRAKKTLGLSEDPWVSRE